MIGISNVITFCTLILLSMGAWAQSPCPQDYFAISPNCIVNSGKKFEDKPIPLAKLTKNTIFFYKTPSGEYGKLKVLSVKNDEKKECTVYIDAVTFSNTGSFVPNSSLSISPERNHWLKNKIYLDREGLSALELERNNKGCVLVLTKGAEIALYKNGSKEDIQWTQKNYALYYAPLVLIFVAIFIIVRTFLEDQDKYKTQEAFEEAENSSKGSKQALFIRLTKPFYKRYFLPIVQSSKHKQGIKAKYRQKIANAGLTKDMTPEEFVALKFFMIIGGPFAFLLVRWLMSATWPVSLTPLMGVVGYFYPDVWVSGMIKRRNDEVLRAMPFIVDMLALSVEAGLDFMAAIQRVIEKAPRSPLVDEFETLIRETKIGSSRAEGLRQLGWRVNLIEINSFCATLIAADSVGASIGPLLKQLSNDLRVKRSSRAEQLGATAATKILIPMIFFILPAVLVAIFAPMVLKMMSGKL
jgi:tight adherence protein C